MQQAGLWHRKFYTLRHTHASQRFAGGVDLAEVARRSSASVNVLLSTDSHWMPSVRDTAQAVDAIYASGPRLKVADDSQGGSQGGKAEGELT